MPDIELEHAVARLKELMKEKGHWLIEKQRMASAVVALEAANECLLEENAKLAGERAKLRAGVTLVAIELDVMRITDISKALRAVLAAASEGQP